MRPVDRGDWPTDADGKRMDYSSEYQKARGVLIERIGEYCSYCEARIQSGLAVEHVLPKKNSAGHDMPERYGDWNNFLLACTNCNSHKLNKEVHCLRPDRDNTFFALEYEDGAVSPRATLTDAEKELAQNLIDLVGLNVIPSPVDPRASDRRWNNRRLAWQKAKEYHESILATDCPEELQKRAIDMIVFDGHWSIWMTVFKDLPSFCARLVEALPGTAKRYFDNGTVLEIIR